MSSVKTWPGDPAAVWAASAGPGTRGVPGPRPIAPDVSGFEAFADRVAPPMPGIGIAVVYLIAGLFFLAEGTALFVFRPEPLEDAQGFEAVFSFFVTWHWVAAFAVGLYCVLNAPRVYRRDRRDHPGEVRALYEASLDRGIMCEVFATSFKVPGSDGATNAVIGIDARLDPERAARVRRAFRAWFAVLRADRRADNAMSDQHRGRKILTSAEVFGPEAEGGYLIGGYHRAKWMMLIPDPPDRGRSWDVYEVGEA